MNKSVVNFFKWLAIGFVAFYCFMQIYSIFINPVTTDTVYAHSAFSGYQTKGYIVRNETIVTNDQNGSLSFAVPDGGRVAKGGTIAAIYQSEQDANYQTTIDHLQEQIETLQTIQGYNDVNAADLPKISGKIHTALMGLLESTQSDNITGDDSEKFLLEMLNRKQIVTGEISDFSGLIASLKSQKATLEAALSTSKGTINAPESGYVICSVDGYEQLLKTDDLENLTSQMLSEIEPSNVNSNAVCKIVSDYQWYIAVKMPFDESLKLKTEDKVTLMTDLVSAPELSATVKYINKESAKDGAVVVFSCDTMNTELASLRFIDLTIVYSRYEGLKVDNRAIRKVDSVTGVYVRVASQVKFVPINVLWSNDNYSIVEKQASDKQVLRLYDEIIVKGKNLHDGKIIK